ncbi:uncharacterized protein LOC118748256 [Rhagoletis pomonella]|uniref:uncharacterized protein LOC118748256 n=1 Tax=Rhagoletis pomonella TaxID=28610 RepID=UPI00177C4F87|nr:uncharacterized protein LOC118748256 [Rhagoletis pomonella]
MFRFLNCFTAPKTIAIILLLFIAPPARAVDRASVTSFTPTDSKYSSSSGSGASTQGESHVKRNIKATDLSPSGSATAAAKSYDPPPEFYRGPGSTSQTSSIPSSSVTSPGAAYHNRDSATSSFVSKPITFPDIIGHKKHNSNDPSQQLANSFNNWQQLRGQGAQDRISVKPFSNSEIHGLTSGYAHSSAGGSAHHSYPETRPYADGHYIDYGQPHAGGHYGASGHGGYYGGANSAEIGAIPFDIYGGKGSGQYAGAGGEYSYTYPNAPHEVPAHKGPHELSSKALLAKSFLIPLATAAVLGIAAALVSNPLLLQLGTFSGLPAGATVVGKRRRRRRDLAALKATQAGLETSDESKTAETAASGAHIAYRAHRPDRGMARV